MLATKHGIPLTTLEEHSTLDITIDGADQVDKELNLIKGMGGALTREKIIASASKENIVVVDESKKVRKLGEKDHPVPTEVLPIALPVIMGQLKKMDGHPMLREGKGKVGPVVTDNGNFILDVRFGPIRDASDLARNLKMIPGVIETGLFIDMTSIVYVGKSSGVEKLERK
jgi:ribose 5-phosphate isomerase A